MWCYPPPQWMHASPASCRQKTQLGAQLGHLGAQLGQFGLQVLLVIPNPFDRVDQVWNEVVTPLDLHIDLRPELQGRGVGRQLIDELLRRLATAGSHGVHLGVDTRNTHAIGFYEHLGFRRHELDEGLLFTRSLP